VRVITVAECASHAVVAAAIGAQSQGEQSLAASLYPRLGEDWLVIADRGFYSFAAWNAARAGGTQLLWRVKADLTLPVVQVWADGVVHVGTDQPEDPRQCPASGATRGPRGDDLDEQKAVLVRMVEYTVPDRVGDGTGELITTITDASQAPATVLAATYHDRWGAT